MTVPRRYAAVLPAYPGRASQAGAVLGADRTAHLQNDAVDLLGQVPQLHHILGPLQGEERPHVDLAGGGVDQVRRRRLVALEDVLDSVQVDRQ